VRLAADQREWDELGTVDPAWAILSDPERRGGKWSEDDFLATGPRDIAPALAHFAALEAPAYGSALDFGCGLGRLTRALSGSFADVVGVDIAPSMVAGARRMHADQPGLRFVVNDRSDLREVADDASFDLVFSFIALQHVSSREAIREYVREFVRIVRPGGLVAFQLPSWVTPLLRLQPRRHAYRVLRRGGVPARVLQDRLKLHPMAMRFVPEGDVRAALEGAGGRIVEIARVDPRDDLPGFRSTWYYATR
jgi:SAM-dependent methyltransferase